MHWKTIFGEQVGEHPLLTRHLEAKQEYKTGEPRTPPQTLLVGIADSGGP